MSPATSTLEQERQDVLDAVKRQFGYVPNFFEEISRSPAATQVYLNGMQAMEQAFLDETEQEIVKFTISLENHCDYCTAAHRVALKQTPLASEVQRVEEGQGFQNPHYQYLALLTRLIMEKKGWVTEEDLKTYEDAGISREKVYEIIALLALKTLSNYVNHIAHIPLDEKLKG